MKYLPNTLLFFTLLSANLSTHTAYALESETASLMDIYVLATANDHQLRSQQAQYFADREITAISRAELLPDISFTGAASESEADSNVNSTATTTDTTTTSYQLSLTQTLIDKSAWHTYQSGQIQEQLAEVTFRANQQNLMLRTAQTYFDTLRQVDQLKTDQAEEKAQLTLLEQTQQRYEVGLIPLSDVHEVRAAYDNAVANRINTEANVGIQYDSLSVLTGKTHTNIAPLANGFVAIEPEPTDKNAWVTFATDNNLSLKASELTADIARLNTEVIKGDRYPTLTGSLSYSDSDQNADAGATSTDTETDTTTVSLNLTIPLYQGGRFAAQERQAAQNEIRRKEEFLLAQRQTIQSTRSLYLAVTTAITQIKARKQTIISRESVLEAIKAGYEAGTRNIVDVVDAQSDLFQAQRDYFDTLYDYVINTLQLKQAAGNLQVADLEALEKSLTIP